MVCDWHFDPAQVEQHVAYLGLKEVCTAVDTIDQHDVESPSRKTFEAARHVLHSRPGPDIGGNRSEFTCQTPRHRAVETTAFGEPAASGEINPTRHRGKETRYLFGKVAESAIHFEYPVE